MISLPPIPPLPDAQRGAFDLEMRHEDLCQDGRVYFPSLLSAGAPPLWSRLLYRQQALPALFAQGIIPVLSRLVIVGSTEPFTLAGRFTVTGAYQLAHAGNGDAVERLMSLMWCEMRGTRGRIAGPKPAGAGEQASCGGFFLENVFTRLFAPPEQRKVVRFDVPGVSAIPEHRHPMRSHEAILTLPEGAVPLEPTLSPDLGSIVFGLCHTDANQHVNSIIYPRMFEEAALRRFAKLGISAPGLSRAVEVGYRKPSFAGDRARILLQTFALGERRGAIGVFVDDGDQASVTKAKPRCYLQMIFED